MVSGYPHGRVSGDCVTVTLKRHQILKRGHVVSFGGVDQAHAWSPPLLSPLEDVTEVGPIQGMGEERVPAMQDRLFKNSFTGLLSRAPDTRGNKTSFGPRFYIVRIAAPSADFDSIACSPNGACIHRSRAIMRGVFSAWWRSSRCSGVRALLAGARVGIL